MTTVEYRFSTSLVIAFLSLTPARAAEIAAADLEQTNAPGPVIERIRPQAEGLSWAPHFTRIVTSRGGRHIRIAAIGATDGEGNIIGVGDIAAQARQIYKKIAIALKAAGAGPADVVRQRTYVVGLKPEHGTVLKALMEDFYPAGQAPTAALLGIETLIDPRLMLEIEITAVVSDRKKPR